MKTITQIAKECGAWQSEPIYQLYNANVYAWYDKDKSVYDKYLNYGGFTVRTVYLAPPQPQSVSDALEMAAKLAERMPINSDVEAHAYRFSDDCKAIAWDIAHAIRALIDQPAKGGICLH